jgi:hypothetical protein
MQLASFQAGWSKVDVARMIENLSDKDIADLRAIIKEVRSGVALVLQDPAGFVYRISRQRFAGISDEALENEFHREVDRLVRIGWEFITGRGRGTRSTDAVALGVTAVKVFLASMELARRAQSLLSPTSGSHRLADRCRED